eukprot:3266589-Prymnesium_polylepis.1
MLSPLSRPLGLHQRSTRHRRRRIARRCLHCLRCLRAHWHHHHEEQEERLPNDGLHRHQARRLQPLVARVDRLEVGAQRREDLCACPPVARGGRQLRAEEAVALRVWMYHVAVLHGVGAVARHGAVVVGRIDERNVRESRLPPAVRRRVAQRAERPDDRVHRHRDAVEQERHEPSLHVVHKAGQRVLQKREDLCHTLGRQQHRKVDDPEAEEAGPRKIANRVRRGKPGKEAEHEDGWKLNERLNEDVGGRMVHAVLHLALDNLDLEVGSVHGDEAEHAGQRDC